MMFYIIEPDPAGDLGPESEMQYLPDYTLVTKVHYTCDIIPRDDVVYTALGVVLATEEVCAALEVANLTGYTLEEAKVEPSDVLTQYVDAPILPTMKWIRLTGEAYVDDFGLFRGVDVVVSERTLALFRRFKFQHCDISESRSADTL